MDRIRDKYRVHYKDYDKKYWSRVKSIELGGNWYGYSHSGIEFEYDELFAITFAFIVSGEGEFKNADIQKEYQEMLHNLTCK